MLLFNIPDEFPFAFPYFIHITSLLLFPQMISLGYILQFFIHRAFSSSTHSDQFIINMKILDVVVRVVIRPAFSSLIKDENKLSEGPSSGRDGCSDAMQSISRRKQIDTLLRVKGIFPEFLLLASVLFFFPRFFSAHWRWVRVYRSEDEVIRVYHQALDLNPF